MQKRIEYLDGLKGFSMLLIMFVHMIPSNYSSHVIIWGNFFKISLFYFVSGYLIFLTKKKASKKVYFNYFKRIMVPYFTFSFIFFLCDAIIARGNYKQIFFRDLLDTITFRGIGVLWFLPTIFIASILLLFTLDKSRIFLFSILFSLILFFYFHNLFNSTQHEVLKYLFLLLGKSSFAYFNLAISYFIFKYLSHIKKSYQKIICLILLFVSFSFSLLNGDVDLNNYGLGNSQIYYVITSTTSLLGIFIMFSLWYNYFPNIIKKFLNYIGKYSLNIMIIHFYPAIILKKIITLESFSAINTNLITLLSFIVLIAVSILITEIINKSKLSFLFGMKN